MKFFFTIIALLLTNSSFSQQIAKRNKAFLDSVHSIHSMFCVDGGTKRYSLKTVSRDGKLLQIAQEALYLKSFNEIDSFRKANGFDNDESSYWDIDSVVSAKVYRKTKYDNKEGNISIYLEVTYVKANKTVLKIESHFRTFTTFFCNALIDGNKSFQSSHLDCNYVQHLLKFIHHKLFLSDDGTQLVLRL